MCVNEIAASRSDIQGALVSSDYIFFFFTRLKRNQLDFIGSVCVSNYNYARDSTNDDTISRETSIEKRWRNAWWNLLEQFIVTQTIGLRAS